MIGRPGDDVATINAAAPAPLALCNALGLVTGPRSTSLRAVVHCPWHNDKHPSCVVTAKQGRIVAYCHACHEGGDLLSLVAQVNGLDVKHDFPRVKALAATLVGVRLDTGRRFEPPPRRDPAQVLADRIDDAADAWLRGRDVQPTALAGASYGACGPALDILKGRDGEARGKREVVIWLASEGRRTDRSRLYEGRLLAAIGGPDADRDPTAPRGGPLSDEQIADEQADRCEAKWFSSDRPETVATRTRWDAWTAAGRP